MVNRRGPRKQRVCPWCSQNFTKDEHLARHIRSHTKERPFSCSACNKSFTRHSQRSAIGEHSNRGSHLDVGLSTSSLTQSTPSVQESQPPNSLSCDYEPLGLGEISSWVGLNPAQPMDNSNHVELAPNSLDRLEATDIGAANPWAISARHQIPGWMVSEDFDMSALNAYIPSSGAYLDTQIWPMNSGRASQMENNVIIGSPSDMIPQPREEYIRQQWFTFIGPEQSGHITPETPNEPTSVDESYREGLSRELQQRINNEPLPSTDFLWESYLVRGAPDALAMTQAILIGQTFGMLSGNPRHLVLVQMFHGTVIAWARRQNIFDRVTSIDVSPASVKSDLEGSWRRWIHNEEKRRVAAGLRIYDGELAELFMTEPFLRSSPSRESPVATDDLWTAQTSTEWAHIVEERSRLGSAQLAYGQDLDNSISGISSPHYSSFALYSLLGRKISYIMDQESVQQPPKEVIPSLILIYNDCLRQQTQPDDFSLGALWHSIFILLHCNMDKFECAIGREGFDKAQENRLYATRWASSMDGHRCAIHAALILQRLQRIPVGQEPAIHVPRVLYRACLVCMSKGPKILECALSYECCRLSTSWVADNFIPTNTSFFMRMEFEERIDVHAHALPPFYREACINAGHAQPDGMPKLPDWDVESHLSLMKKLNISKSILSISSPGSHLTEGNNEAARSLTRSCNNYMADLVSVYPSQLGYWASLPLPDVEGSLEEIAHTSGKANGVTLKTNYYGIYLGDNKFDAIFEELNRRHAKVFIHPTTPCVRQHTRKDGRSMETVAATPLTQFANPIFEFMFDTARALMNLFISGTIARCPNVTFITPHAGGALLPMIERFTSLGRMIGGPGQDLSSQIIKDTFARQFYFDLAGFPFPDQVRELLLYVKTDRLLYGSDYPFTPEKFVLDLAGIMKKEMGGMWKEEERTMILLGNARRLLS
ncbi:hypothetical protein UA08_03341 [Talaromyces atroroseus]|uniref:6-methylsalicylate decarboxylase n=1 Tax=Talaromyces atroroseus TaxID=1441469 RepID=A0A225AZD0_TALAT|nr:hypothetical protein UA08_03341 [Talaromyces atroroseus]OKL61069.1 hypothetical protein UA08_03341 [Talaromyces atroroseus]